MLSLATIHSVWYRIERRPLNTLFLANGYKRRTAQCCRCIFKCIAKITQPRRGRGAEPARSHVILFTHTHSPSKHNGTHCMRGNRERGARLRVRVQKRDRECHTHAQIVIILIWLKWIMVGRYYKANKYNELN